jgi:hypothetical protein
MSIWEENMTQFMQVDCNISAVHIVVQEGTQMSVRVQI